MNNLLNYIDSLIELRQMAEELLKEDFDVIERAELFLELSIINDDLDNCFKKLNYDNR